MLLLKQLGLGLVQPQFGLQDAVASRGCDFRVGRHLVEFDGRLKYQRVEERRVRRPLAGRGHLARRSERQDWLCGFKLGMSRVVWSDVQPDTLGCDPATRLLREILDTERSVRHRRSPTWRRTSSAGAGDGDPSRCNAGLCGLVTPF